MCDHCNATSETRRVSATGFYAADPLLRAKLRSQRRSYYDLCHDCVAFANAGGVLGSPRSHTETHTAVTRCVLCQQLVHVVQTELVTLQTGRVSRQVIDVQQATRCACWGVPAFVVGAVA